MNSDRRIPGCGLAMLAAAKNQSHCSSFCDADAELLRSVAERWQHLSEHPDATDCQTDHCHVELDELENIALKIEVLLLWKSCQFLKTVTVDTQSIKLTVEQRFRHVWKLLCSTWIKNRHCLLRGCGRETLAYWVRESCHDSQPAWLCRSVLMEAVNRGWAIKRQSSSGHSIFILKT